MCGNFTSNRSSQTSRKGNVLSTICRNLITAERAKRFGTRAAEVLNSPIKNSQIDEIKCHKLNVSANAASASVGEI